MQIEANAAIDPAERERKRNTGEGAVGVKPELINSLSDRWLK